MAESENSPTVICQGYNCGWQRSLADVPVQLQSQEDWEKLNTLLKAFNLEMDRHSLETGHGQFHVLRAPLIAYKHGRLVSSGLVTSELLKEIGVRPASEG